MSTRPSLNWRHTPSVRHFAKATNPDAEQLDIASYDIFDLAANYRASDTVQFRAGIDNLFDKAPNIFGAIPGVTDSIGEPEPGGSFDVLGRRFYVGAKVTF